MSKNFSPALPGMRIPRPKPATVSPNLEPHQVGLTEEELPPIERHPVCLVLDQLRSAYNVGALFRTADGAGLERIALLGRTPHPPHPQVEKTALGATSYVPWTHYREVEKLVQTLREQQYQLVALENGPGAQDLWTFPWPERVALVAGNEVEGISPELLEHCDLRLNIPMHGYKRTLNVTTAVGIALYDCLRSYKI